MSYKVDFQYGPAAGSAGITPATLGLGVGQKIKIWTPATGDPLPWPMTDEWLVAMLEVTALAYEVTLPAISATNKGTIRFIALLGTAVSPVIVTPSGADTIDNAANYSIPAAQSNTIGIVSDGISNWSIVMSNY